MFPYVTFLATSLVFADQIRLKQHFHWLVPQTVAIQVAGQMSNYAMTCSSIARGFAQSLTDFYFSQWWQQLNCCVECLWQGMLHWAFFVQLVWQQNCTKNYLVSHRLEATVQVFLQFVSRPGTRPVTRNIVQCDQPCKGQRRCETSCRNQSRIDQNRLMQ